MDEQIDAIPTGYSYPATAVWFIAGGVVTAILGSVYQLRGNGRLVPHTQTQTQAQMKAKAEHPISSAQPIFPGQPGEGTIGPWARTPGSGTGRKFIPPQIMNGKRTVVSSLSAIVTAEVSVFY